LRRYNLTFLRIRSKNHEIMIAPDKDYILAGLLSGSIGSTNSTACI
jgi:hypothetical protein